MSDQITITFGRFGNAEQMYVMTFGEQMVVGNSVERLFHKYRALYPFRDRLLWPSKSIIRAACKIARNNPAGAALERRDGKWEVVEVKTDE